MSGLTNIFIRSTIENEATGNAVNLSVFPPKYKKKTTTKIRSTRKVTTLQYQNEKKLRTSWKIDYGQKKSTVKPLDNNVKHYHY